MLSIFALGTERFPQPCTKLTLTNIYIINIFSHETQAQGCEMIFLEIGQIQNLKASVVIIVPNAITCSRKLLKIILEVILP